MHHRMKNLQQRFFATASVKQFIESLLLSILQSTGYNGEDIVEKILGETVLHEQAVRHSPSRPYVLSFLKSLLRSCESCDICCETLYSLYAAKIQEDQGDSDPWVRLSYQMKGGDWIRVKQKRSIISDGTTGFHTWAAGICFANIVEEQQLFSSGKRILEVGSGVGAAGILIAKTCDPKSVVLSDVEPNILSTLQKNVNANFENDSRVAVRQLDFSSFSDVDPVDIVFGCDILYDLSLLQPLVSFISHCFSWPSVPQVYVASVTRNSATQSAFELLLEHNNISFSFLTNPKETTYWYNTTEPVKVYSLKPADQ